MSSRGASRVRAGLALATSALWLRLGHAADAPGRQANVEGLCRQGSCSRESVLLQRGRALTALLPTDVWFGRIVSVPCTIRDFTADHPDFYVPEDGPPGRSFGHLKGCVQEQLGPDRKPVFAEGGACFNSSASFAQWFNDVPGVNRPVDFTMDFIGTFGGSFAYESSAFFPVDGKGWMEDAYGHNYWFTMELHTEFTYLGGETFRFRGDDDVWVFINGTLAMDLGGIHTPLDGSVALDALNLTKGQEATLDFFFAERQPYLSNFMVETLIDLIPAASEGSCMIWGDPHANVFDSVGPHDSVGETVVNIFGYGDFWIVKSDRIFIQGRYNATQWSIDGQSATRAIAVGGDFLSNHTMIIEAMDGQILWDGTAILQDFPSQFTATVEDSSVTAKYYNISEPIDRAQPFRPIHGVEVTLPLGVRLTVNRWAKHLDVTVTMKPQTGGQDGHCGNFNGNATDDSVEQIRARFDLRVPTQDSLFLVPAPSDAASDPTENKLEDCPPEVRELAEAECQEQEASAEGEARPASYLEACIYDKCFGGEDFGPGA